MRRSGRARGAETGSPSCSGTWCGVSAASMYNWLPASSSRFPCTACPWPPCGRSAEHPGITVNELARLTGLPKSRVSVLMTRLAAQRIVRKDSDEHDSRLVRLRITPEGRQCVADWTVASQRAIGALLQPLGDDELDIIARGLAALQRAFQRAQEQGTAGHAGSPPPC